MIVEDDPGFAQVMADLGRERGFKIVVATRGTDAIASARELRPDAISFDIGLPDLDGWRVLDRLKDDPETRHIPVFLVSAADELERGRRSGAVGFLAKPAERGQIAAAFSRLRELVEQQQKRLLVLEGDLGRRSEILEIIGNSDVDAQAVASASEALALLSAQRFDCIVLSTLGDYGPVLALLRKLEANSELRGIPVILYGPGELWASAEDELRALSSRMVLKQVRSLERLFDETALYLHRDAARLPEDKQAIVRRLHSTTEALTGRTVLIVDDDVRNIFAMTSLLERHGMQVISAENGREALQRLESTPAIAVVLMDIMLPEMDGYETTRAIRSMPDRRTLPILALTAKAMKGDREKCLEAGASDYIAKPVEADHLVAQLRSWLQR
jgi:CheY-like chemotaxis protein